MNRTQLSALAFAAAALSTAGAQAADGSLSREQVRAELAQAQRTGDLLAAGEIGLPRNHVMPAGHGAQPDAAARSRDAVQAELAQYRREGVKPWSKAYDPLKSFKSSTRRADVTAGFLADRAQVAAFNGEDSGSAYLAARDDAAVPGAPRLAGTPVSGN